MKKVGLITYSGADNYGSLLQCYALKETLETNKIAHVDIINYVSKEQKEMYGTYFKNNSLKNIIKNIYIFLFLKTIKKNRQILFDDFRKQFLKIDKNNEINNSSELNDKGYDTIICGSDQIWNVNIPDYKDLYMLDFVKNAKKISYAASMGGVDLNLTYEQKINIKKLLNTFSAISVRENIAKNMIQGLVNENIQVNIDPVFLLGYEKWNEIASPRLIENDYIFFYSIDYNENSIKMAKELQKKYNLPVYTLNTFWSSYFIKEDGFKVYENCSVQDFISLIKYAKLVLSGSFHGTAFSIIFNKQFFRLKKGNKNSMINDDRVITLLDKLKIKDREISIENYKLITENISEIDYSLINENIQKEKILSLEYLKNNI